MKRLWSLRPAWFRSLFWTSVAVLFAARDYRHEHVLWFGFWSLVVGYGLAELAWSALLRRVRKDRDEWEAIANRSIAQCDKYSDLFREMSPRLDVLKRHLEGAAK